MIRHVAIIGAGFSGTLQAINLLRHDGPRATLIERGAVAGRGIAYGAADPSHLLNVRAGNMSAFPDEPDHFVRWLGARGMADAAGGFVPRLVFGEYLQSLLDAARATAGERLAIVAGEAVDVETGEDVRIRLADGRVLAADAAVLAAGNLPPHAPPGLDPAQLSPDRYRSNPWATDLADGLGAGDTVLLIGTGLTMVDVALTLDARGFRGRMVALSRRGLLPRRHKAARAPDQPLDTRPVATPSALVRIVRERAGEICWRQAVDELRPFTQGIWANASRPERQRFLRHLRPWWDVHRHRIAPAVAERLAALRAEGRLVTVAGKTMAFAEVEQGIAVQWRPRGTDRPERLVVQRIVNCTGPQGDLTRTEEPLLQALLARGAIRPDAEHLGLDVDPGCAVVGAGGAAGERLFALGPMTRGAFWEIVAVPDIRRQSWDLARRLSNAHWVAGEGL
ncbi:FAD/NAD(P)-binding protein [Sphingomonas aracearum]|uniref:FAD-dependent oxidoreductase n=1 Tax=Sphingomonas aracearum TaxID=2283317 RepID=A0A369VU87_9SPHN|nr:FAD/NAD(P)-binding protein [Sphingomonas aracearum]RDE05653.1 FAD-dependent oxidoreductase [Sphingomonas aracearum]